MFSTKQTAKPTVYGVGRKNLESGEPDLYDITFEVVADGKVLDRVGSYLP